MSKERITQIRESTGLSMRKFADRIGVSVSTVSLLEKGERELQLQTAKAICKEFKVNELWLLSGEGDMYDPISREDEMGQIAADLFNMSPDDPRIDMIKIVKDMSDEEIGVITNLAKKFLESIIK